MSDERTPMLADRVDPDNPDREAVRRADGVPSLWAVDRGETGVIHVQHTQQAHLKDACGGQTGDAIVDQYGIVYKPSIEFLAAMEIHPVREGDRIRIEREDNGFTRFERVRAGDTR